MKSITEQLSKEIVTACEGATAGIVTNVFTDAKLTRVRGYKAVNDEADEAKMIPLPRVLGDGDAIVLKNLSALKDGAFSECPLGAKIFDTCGVLHGVLRDLIFDEKSGEVLSLLADESEIAPERVLSFGKKAVVLRAAAHEKTQFKRASSKAHRPMKKQAPRPVVEAQAAPAPKEEAKASALPQSELEGIFPGYAFLLGRKVTKTILNGETVIAAEEQTVTPDVILRARENGKLVELTVNSRK